MSSKNPMASLLLLCTLSIPLAGLLGCGSAAEHASRSNAAADDDGIRGVSPQQLQRARKQLTSGRWQQQLAGLKFVQRFPSILQSHRQLVEKLSQQGASRAVRGLAAKLLEEAAQSE